MTDATNGAAEEAQVQLNVVNQYVRDLSFENVLAQKGSNREVQPDVKVTVNLDAKGREPENHYEVSLKLNVVSQDKDDADTKLFIMEIDYVGLFMITGVPEEHLHPFLLIECPRLLFPFLRRIVSDVSRDGGFPPLNLDNIDFAGLYRQEIMRRSEEEGAQPLNS